MLILLITFPYIVRNKQLVFKIDNAAVMGGWQTGYVRNNETASEIPEFREVKGSLLKWLEDPCKNGDLCKIILK